VDLSNLWENKYILWLGAVAGVVGLWWMIATQKEWPPFGNEQVVPNLVIKVPSAGFMVTGDLHVTAAGAGPDGGVVWFVGRSASNKWFPLQSGSWNGSAKNWSAVISRRQIVADFSLCPVLTNSAGADSLDEDLGMEEVQSGGLDELPDGSRHGMCIPLKNGS